MTEINMNSLLMQMRAMAQQTQSMVEPVPPNGTHFSSLVGMLLDKVNETQQNAAARCQAFETGKDRDPADGAVSRQPANDSVPTVTEVGNKLLSAYREIMNMPI